MSETPDGRSRPTPRPTPQPRSGAAARPTPRPRVAGSRREREEADGATSRAPRPAPVPQPSRPGRATARGDGRTTTTGAAKAAPEDATAATHRRFSALVLVLAVLCALVATGGGVLLRQRLHPSFVDASIFSAARSGVQALYAYDYRDSDGSVRRKLAVLTGDLRDQYKSDLSQGGIIDTYKQVSATTSYHVLDVGLQQVNNAQDTATLVVFGEYVVKSVNSGNQPAPQGSECQVTPEGAQSCTQTVQVRVTKAGGTWKISELTLLTTS
jgi:hypothetical protein